jgi:hypothetical protein
MIERPAKESPPACLGPIAFGIAVSVLVRFGIGVIPVRSGEPIALRWARVLADHPVRASIAAAFLFVALRPRAGPVSAALSSTNSTPDTNRSAGEGSVSRSSH